MWHDHADCVKIKLPARELEATHAALRPEEIFLAEFMLRMREDPPPLGAQLWTLAGHLDATLGQLLFMIQKSDKGLSPGMAQALLPALFLEYRELRRVWGHKSEKGNIAELNGVAARVFQIVEFACLHAVLLPLPMVEASTFAVNREALLSALGIEKSHWWMYEDVSSDEPASLVDRLVGHVEEGASLKALGFSANAILQMGDPQTPDAKAYAVREAYDMVPMTVCTLPELRPGWNMVSLTNRQGSSTFPAYNLTCGNYDGELKIPDPPSLPGSVAGKMSQADETKYWYHACRVPALVSIVRDGIDTSKIGNDSRTDFARDGAFYLNPSATHQYGALNWCVNRAEAEHMDDFAIIRFKLADANWHSFAGRAYTADSEELEKLVRICRKNGTNRDDRHFLRSFERKDVKWIRGPMVINPAKVSRGEEAPAFAHDQLALRHVDIGHVFEQAIESLVVIDPSLMEALVAQYKQSGRGKYQREDFDEWKQRKNERKAAQGPVAASVPPAAAASAPLPTAPAPASPLAAAASAPPTELKTD